jgi:hypothetical protein
MLTQSDPSQLSWIVLAPQPGKPVQGSLLFLILLICVVMTPINVCFGSFEWWLWLVIVAESGLDVVKVPRSGWSEARARPCLF